MNRQVLRAALALAAVIGTLTLASSAHAAATVKKISLELGGGVTQIAGGDFNDAIDFVNRQLTFSGRQGFDRITYTFLYDAGFRYFVRPNIALRAGVGQMRSQTKREYLPAIGQDVQLRYELLSVPMHLGADYYFAPYNQGDFQARAFVGGGLLNLVNNRVLYQQYSVLGDPALNRANTFVTSAQRDAAGYYGEFGVHMFFALRYSVVLNAFYRSARMNGLLDTQTKQPVPNPLDGKPFDLDLSGLGARGALCIGF